MTQERLQYALDIVNHAGNLTLEYFYDPNLVIDRKEDQTPVTAADRGAELLLRRKIEERFPEDGILGEEFPAKDGSSGYRWILDPIDGTKSFIHGIPTYSNLIGIEKDGTPVIGIINLPGLGERIWAAKGEGAWHEAPRFAKPVRAKVSSCSSLEESLFLVSEVLTFFKVHREQAYQQLQEKVRLTMSWGDAYGYFLVATGRADVMIDPVVGLWDAAPLLTIIEEAGGRFTDWQGNPTIFHEEAVATNGILHENVLEITKKW